MIGVAIAAPAAALDFPPRKPGLWQSSTGGKVTDQWCLNDRADKALREIDLMCGATLGAEGDKLVYDNQCKTRARTISSHVVMTGDFTSAYHVEVHETYDPPQSPGQGVVVKEAEMRWIGPCLAGQKPGDVFDGDGTKRINIFGD